MKNELPFLIIEKPLRRGMWLKARPVFLLLMGLLISSGLQAQQTTTVTGQVVSTDEGLTLPGVTVRVKGTDRGTTTDVEGNYRIDVPEGSGVLIFSYIGFGTKEIAVENQSVIDVSLDTDVQSLEEVVVVGYGTVKKSDLTGSVASVRGEDLTAIPVTNALEVMQGKVPGLDLTRTSGQSGANLNIQLRGTRSLNASNAPLVLVDGIQYGSTLDVNPNDIASIEVLKDASATAIYGTLGANGVILITTKRGAAGKSKISVNSYYGVQSLGGYADIMSGPQWVQLRREARRTAGEWSSPEDDENILNPVQLQNYRDGIYTDWARELLGTGSLQNHQVSVSGGSDRASYYFSLEYFNEQGLLANDQLERYSGRFTVDYNILDNLKLSTNLMYTIRDHDKRRDPLNQANKMSPLGRPYDDEGNLLVFPVGDASTLNPLVDQQPGNWENNDMNRRFFGNLNLEWVPVQRLTFTSRLGVDASNGREGLFAASNTIETGPDGLSLARLENSNFSRITWENFANYGIDFGVHDIQLLAGTSIWATREENQFGQGRDLLSPTFSFHNLGASQAAFQINSQLTQTQLASYFGRLNYKVFEKYIATVVMRADGSSVLAEGNKWGFFPSMALSWLLKEEDFLAGSELISEMKLRASYGISGNSAVDPYQTRGGLSKSTYAFDQGTAETPAFGFYPSLIATPGLSWETTATTNLGLDFGFFNNRIVGALDVYEQSTTGLLMQRRLPTSTGFRAAWDNVGSTRNRGVELALSTINVDRPNGLSWNSDFTFTANREEIVDIGGPDRDIANGWFVGHPVNVHYDYEKIGIWQLGEEDLAAENQQDVGQIRVKDQDGDGVITPEDRVILGTTVPNFSLGINNRFAYKGADLTFFIFAREGQMIVSEAHGSYKIDGLENGPMVDYWTPENPTNAYPRPDAATSRSSTRYYSTLRYVDGSFLKIRDITLGYSLPPSVTERVGLGRFRLYATARNWFVFSHMGEYDPERGGNLSFPMTRQMVFGVNIEL